LDSGSTVTLQLTGSGTSPNFTYQLLVANPGTPITPGGTISFPDTILTQTSSIVVRVLNSGNANGTITNVSAAGQGFQVSNLLSLPQTVAPNASLTFTLNFTPALPGAINGTLLVNSDSFQLRGTGLGAQLVYSYVAGGGTIVIGPSSPSVIFS